MGHDEEIYGSEVLLLSYFYIFLFHLLLSLSCGLGGNKAKARQGKAREFWADRQAGKAWLASKQGRQAGKLRAGRDRLAGNGNGRQAGRRAYMFGLFFLLYLFFYILLIISSEILLFFISMFVSFRYYLPTLPKPTIPYQTIPYRTVSYRIYLSISLIFYLLLPCCLMF